MGVLLSTEASQEDLIAAAQADPSNDSEAMTGLLRRFELLALKIGRGTAFTRDTQEDAANAARWGLVLAVRAHKPGTPGFPVFAQLYMRGEASRRSRALIDVRTTPTDDLKVLDVVPEVPHAEPPLDFGSAISVLTLDQRNLAVRRYVDDEPLMEIAVDLGVTVSAVSQRLGTIHKKIQATHSIAHAQVAA